MADGLSKAVDQLRAEEARLLNELNGLTDRAQAMKAELKRVQAALSALDGNSKRKAKPAPTKKHVQDAIAEELQLHNGTLSDEKLRAAVEGRLVAAGLTRSGLELRYREAVASPLFVSNDDGIQLKKQQTNSADYQNTQ